MKTSAKGVAAIALHEGVVTKAYRDVAGVWTIGVGHTSSAGPPTVGPGLVITRQQAMDILARDIARFEARVNKVLPNVSQNAFDGAVSFDFNTGAIDRAAWPTHYKMGRMDKAEAGLHAWNKAGGRIVQGLVNRRKAEADLIFRGKYPPGIGSVALRPPEDASDKATVKEFQGQLAELGYDVGPIDGIRGARTIAAVKAFQKDHDLVVDGIVGPATRATLARALAAKHAPDDPGPVTPPKKPVKGVAGADSLT